MIPIAHYLFAAAFSGAFNKKNWQDWADKQILKSSSVEDWIYETSLANNIDMLSKALANKLIDEKYRSKNLPLISDAVIGYYYLKYLEGKVTVNELLEMSASEADGGEASMECEQLYSILNEIEKNDNTIQNKDFTKSIQKLFETFKIIAEQQKRVLEEY